MIRLNYYELGGWTLEEYLHYWEGEREMEKIIAEGKFPIFIKKLSKLLDDKPPRSNTTI